MDYLDAGLGLVATFLNGGGGRRVFYAIRGDEVAQASLCMHKDIIVQSDRHGSVLAIPQNWY